MSANQDLETCSKSDIYSRENNCFQRLDRIFSVCVQQQQMDVIVLFLINETWGDNLRYSPVDELRPVLSWMEQCHAACGWILEAALKLTALEDLTLTFTAMQHSTENKQFSQVFIPELKRKNFPLWRWLRDWSTFSGNNRSRGTRWRI